VRQASDFDAAAFDKLWISCGESGDTLGATGTQDVVVRARFASARPGPQIFSRRSEVMFITNCFY
jgi:hypothetical protein